MIFKLTLVVTLLSSPFQVVETLRPVFLTEQECKIYQAVIATRLELPKGAILTGRCQPYNRRYI